MAAKSQEGFLPTPPHTADLVRLSQCGSSEQELLNMEKSIREKLQGQCKPVTSLDFLLLFYRLIVEHEDPEFLVQLTRLMEVLICSHAFNKFRVGSCT